ncbi:MAG: guanylate kinase, partial [Bacillota bacterium]|nr:guanylate kinase [Bacillota bacterium]
MSKIYIIMGKSASGKDTIYKKLLEHKQLNLKNVVTYTTRPIRVYE